MRPAGLSDQTVHVEILPPDGATFGSLALSPDGRQLAFVASQQGKKLLWVRTMATAAQRPLAGTDGAVHGAEGLYVADGSLLPSSIGVNPMMTIIAMASRVARQLADRSS